MKKLLAILLAMAMLCSLACVGTSALTPEEELLEEALGYIAQTAEIFESGTFTLKMREGKNWPVETWVYDRENDQKMFEFDFRKMVYGNKVMPLYSGSSKTGKFFTDAFVTVLFWTLAMITGPVRPTQIGSRIFAALPRCGLYSSDVSGTSIMNFMSGWYENFNGAIDCYVYPDEVVEVKKEGNVISLLTDDNRYFEITDGNLSFYRGTRWNGTIPDTYIESLSPVADQSYFSTKGMRELPLGWLANLLSWLEAKASNS